MSKEMSVDKEYQDDEELFKRLRTKPVVAWPTLILLLVCDTAIATVWYLCLTGQLSLWAGCLVNTIAMYYLFSPMHDAMHMAVFRNQKLNHVALFVSVFPIIPFVTGQFLRMMHMQHHRFTNDEMDPDHALSMNLRNALGRWFVWGHLYPGFYEKHRQHYPPYSERLKKYDRFVALAVLALLLVWNWQTTLMLLVLPGFFFAWLITLVFMYLPHRPHNVRHADDPYRATLIRKGWEWLLSPLMANQNYHLVHHLYPTVPFYRYRKVWYAKEGFHMSHNPAIVRPLQLLPDPSPETSTG